MPVQQMTTCGHCNVNHHSACPGGVRNGNGTIHLCGCRKEGCLAGQKRCTECHNRTQDEIGEDWHCLNKNDCDVEVQRRLNLNPSYLRIRALFPAPVVALEDTAESEGVPTPRESRRSTRGTGKPCLCECGEVTGGGKFRPGHDSKYLNRLVEAGDQTAKNLAYAVSEAFGKKYDKRVTK